MKRRQRKQRQKRRQCHAQSVDRPRLVISRDRYSTVKQGHIVPEVFQKSFAVDGRVAVHVPGRDDCVLLKTAKAGIRARFYRRQRPDGTDIDDFEAMLADVESRIAPVLRDLAAGASLTLDLKGDLMQFLALQMLRGPAFAESHDARVDRLVRENLSLGDLKPALLAQTGGDMGLARKRVAELLRHPTQRLMKMLTVSTKVSAVLGSMRWQLLRFAEPALAYSDQPVVLWPLDVAVLHQPPDKPRFGPMAALEIQVPLAPTLLLLMTWADEEDVLDPIPVPAQYAAEANALVIAQADKQWMHRPGPEPAVASRPIRPLSRAFEARYTPEIARASERRTATAKYLDRVRHRRFLNDIEVVDLTRQARAA